MRPPGEETRPAVSDADLIAGSRAEFGVLFDRHAAQLYRYCARRVGPDAAEDVIAETFLLAYQSRQRYDPTRPNAIPWLYGIATNVLGRHRRHRAIAAGAASDVSGVDESDRAVERADAQAAVRGLARALAQMSGRHRDLLFLIAAGLDYDEVAAALGVPVGTVRSGLHRARSRLRRLAVRQGIDTPDWSER
jgi:RNA polymerase sigma-70 factor (ECF subfamily)